jgi:hypothetical protein
MLAAALLASLAGCNGATATQAACSDLARAVCAKEAQCSPYEMQIQFANDSSACASLFVSGCNENFSIKGLGLTPANLEACASALNAQSCAEVATKTPDVCANPPGTLANGEGCFESSQCQGGVCSFGVGNGTSPATSCGTCATANALEGCSADSQCPGTQVCVLAGTGGGGSAGTCVTPGALGAPCGPGGEAPCEGDLVCQIADDAGTTGTCASPPTNVGAPCETTTRTTVACGGDLQCVNNVCQNVTYVPAGGACSTTGAPVGGAVQVCAASVCYGGRCVASAAVGSACAPSSSTGPACVDGASCVNGVCTASVPPTCN